MDLKIELGHVFYGMGGTSEPSFWDYEQGKPRQPTKQDMINNTRLGHALPDIDFVQTLCMSGDQQTDMIFFHDFDAIFRNTTKPTVLDILERPFTRRLLEMAAAALGGEEALRQKPSMLGIATPVSPLKIPIMNEGIIDAVNAGVPILYSPGPLMGANWPRHGGRAGGPYQRRSAFRCHPGTVDQAGRTGGAQTRYGCFRYEDHPGYLWQP